MIEICTRFNVDRSVLSRCTVVDNHVPLALGSSLIANCVFEKFVAGKAKCSKGDRLEINVICSVELKVQQSSLTRGQFGGTHSPSVGFGSDAPLTSIVSAKHEIEVSNKTVLSAIPCHTSF